MSSVETPSLCPFCGVGCGLLVRTRSGRITEIAGDPGYPVNRGRTCRKPLELASAVHAADRALTPMRRADRRTGFTAVGWDSALAELAARLTAISGEHGPDALGFYISGQLLTEDYYTVGKLVRGFLRTNNLDSNSRLCMSSAVAGYNGAFGADGPPPSYADLELADCLLILGSNTAACHPILWSRIRDRQREGACVICVDPRPTPTAQAADLHLALRPGTDLALLNAMLHVIEAEGQLDRGFIERHTTGFEQTIAAAREWSPARAGATCGVDPELIVQAARRFAGAPAAMTLWSMGANQSTVGTLKNRALINLCLATGNLGRPGGGPLSLTGQPNAMGGRESGGLAQLLPGYRRVDSAEDRAAIAAHWGVEDLPVTPGLPAVELFEAAAEGRVKALWIVATNPVVSMPDSALVRAALERAELVVVQDAHVPTETSALADYVLPAAAWPEKQGTMTNSERRVGLVRRALPPPAEARPDWRIFAGLAAALGHGEHFAWADEAAVYAEFAACTAGRPCDVSGVDHDRLKLAGSVQWPEGQPRLYASRRVHTPDRRARFAPTPHSAPAETPDAAFPLVLTTGRLADQWHTMTRTGKSRALRAAAGEPAVELNPDDALAAGVGDGELVAVHSRRGEVQLRACLTPGLPAGVAFTAFHFGALHAPPGAGTVNLTTNRAADPISHQPELKALAVRIEPLPRPRPVRQRLPTRLVVVGTGMAGLAAVEAAVARRGPEQLAVTMLGEEPALPYNRILVSKLLARTAGRGELELRPQAWFDRHAVTLHRARGATAIDLDGHAVTDAAGETHHYDALVLATGSRPFLPPIPGSDHDHVHAFRTVAGAERLARICDARSQRAVVIGGGLLGLEAAAGLLARGSQVAVVELADRPMPQQLDLGGGSILASRLEQHGLRLHLGRSVSRIEPDRVVLSDGEELAATLVVIAAGIRPETSLAIRAGITVNRGVVVDDGMRTDAPDVWAAGECAEHRGVVYGLWAPLAEQARVAGAGAVGDPAAFHGAVTATTLKIAGIDVFSGGVASVGDGTSGAATGGAGGAPAPRPTAPGNTAAAEITTRDTRRGRYRRIVLDGERLAGAMLVGEIAEARTLSQLLRTGETVPEALLDPFAAAAGVGAAGAAAGADPSPDAIVCSCNTVSRGQIDLAVLRGGLSTVAQIGSVTRAGTGCGGCQTELTAILAAHAAVGG